jgi:DNA-directed RNA polymerase specialized sigma24 family protein
MKRDDFIDFFYVEPQHVAIHDLLSNWARWVRVRPHGWQVAPMFRLYRSKSWQWHAPEIREAVNMPEALEMERAVSSLPEKHRTAIRWCYVAQGHPAKVARDLGVSKQGLMDLIATGRTMLNNKVAA